MTIKNYVLAAAVVTAFGAMSPALAHADRYSNPIKAGTFVDEHDQGSATLVNDDALDAAAVTQSQDMRGILQPVHSEKAFQHFLRKIGDSNRA